MPSREKLVQSGTQISGLCRFEYRGVRSLESEKKRSTLFISGFFFFDALGVIKNLILHTEFGVPCGR